MSTLARDARRSFARPGTLRAAGVAGTQKIHNLDADGHCVISAEAEDLPLIVEGAARGVRDEATLRRHPKLSRSVPHRDAELIGDRLDAEFVAPTSRGARFNVCEITPTKAFGLPVDGETPPPTVRSESLYRWRQRCR